MDNTAEVHHVLVVDDDISLLSTLCDMVEVAGYRVSAAIDGQKAWEKFQAEDPDIVFTDIKMPLMDGFELIENIRERHDMIEKYILAFSSDDKPERIVQALNVGANDFVRTPFSVIEVIARMQTASRTLLSAKKFTQPQSEPVAPLWQNGAITQMGEKLLGLYQREMSRAARHGRDLSCVVMAIQNMEEFAANNDAETCTEWFLQIQEGMQELLRSHDIVGKYTDSQLGIILPETRHEQAQQVLDKIRESLQEGNFGTPKLSTPPKLSFGVAGYDVATRSNHVIERASQASQDIPPDNTNDQN
jgi:two-component system, cell cycle response regulator